MGIRARPNSAAEPESDDAEADTIPATISRLKTSFLPADYARAERALVARESSLKREIEKLRNENAKLLEADRFRELEMLRLMRDETGSKDVIGELQRRIRELERQKLKLEGLVQSEYEGWKGLISKLENDDKKLREQKGVGLGVKSGNVGVEVKLEMEEVEGDGIGGVASRDSGYPKFSYEDAVLINRHNECAPKETEMLCAISEIHKDAESLGVIGVERKPRVPKRKPSLSLSGSDDEKRGGKMEEDKHSNSEIKQRQKLRVEAIEPEVLDFSGGNVSENQNLPNQEQVNLRESEVKIMAEQKSQLFHDAPVSLVDVSSDSDNDPSANLSSSSSPSSSDSEDDYLLLSQIDQIIPEAKTREGAALSNESRKML